MGNSWKGIAELFLTHPTNMDMDVRGRIWITEAVDYRNFNNDSAKVKHNEYNSF